MKPDIVLALNGLTKSFGSIKAVKDVSLELKQGEILALLGENGAGKTTLMNMLFGHYLPDSGTIEVSSSAAKKQSLALGNPQAAIAAGIGMVHQHFTLAANLSGLDNIMLGSENLRGLRREKARAEQKIEKIMLRSGLKVPLGISVGQLTVGEQQRIEILKALYRDVKILVLDEPTAVLSPQEADLLFHNLSLMTRNGLSVIFISHKLREVLSFSQRIVILRHGKKVGELVTSEADERKIANLMVGSNKKPVSREVIKPGKIVLELQNLSVQGSSRRESLEKINLSVREHEIIGIAGISGNGQKALAGAISGMTQPNSGSINLNSKTISNIQPSIMIEAGIGRIPDDRHRDGIVGQMTVTENLLLENISSSAFQRFGILKFDAIRRRAHELCERYDIRVSGIDAPARLLSGGNIQKLILARVFESQPRLILANQPTRGLDMKAAAAVAERLLIARKRGAAIVLISEDLDELLSLSDRIIVMRDGKLSDVESLDRDAIGLLMAGEAV
jgi:ABC-type uncharacterized transport system ATPase subunit